MKSGQKFSDNYSEITTIQAEVLDMIFLFVETVETSISLMLHTTDDHTTNKWTVCKSTVVRL